MKAVLDNLKVTKALIVTKENDQIVIKSANNLPAVKTANTRTINVYDILKYDAMVVTREAVADIEEVYV
jgi:large subunit ribosomal protein L4